MEAAAPLNTLPEALELDPVRTVVDALAGCGNVPVPDPGTVTLAGKGLRSQSAQVSSTGVVKLAVIGRGVVRKALRTHHKRSVGFDVTYAPVGSTPVSRSRSAKLFLKPNKAKSH